MWELCQTHQMAVSCVVRREFNLDQNQIEPNIEKYNTSASNKHNPLLSPPSRLLLFSVILVIWKIVELLWILTTNWARRLWSFHPVHMFLLSHIYSEVFLTADMRKNTPNPRSVKIWANCFSTKQKVAKISSNSLSGAPQKHKVVPSQLLDKLQTNKAATSHQVNPSQSRQRRVVSRNPDRQIYILHRSVIKADSSLLDNEERRVKREQRGGEVGAFKTLQLLSWEGTKQAGKTR